MKKIKTQEETDKERKRNTIIISVFFLVLLVLSSLGYAVMSKSDSSNSQKASYGNLKFIQQNGYWQTIINGKTLFFTELPQNLNEISTEANISLSDYYSQQVYIVNPNSAAPQLANALSGIAGSIQEACINESECGNKDLPLKNCDSYLIIYNSSQENSIFRQGNCVYLDGDSFKVTDKFVYNLYGIA